MRGWSRAGQRPIGLKIGCLFSTWTHGRADYHFPQRDFWTTRTGATAAHLLYKIIAALNQKRSTAVVTNVDFEKWGEYLTGGPLAMAFVDPFLTWIGGSRVRSF